MNWSILMMVRFPKYISWGMDQCIDRALLKRQCYGWEYSPVVEPLPTCMNPWVQSPEKKNQKDFKWLRIQVLYFHLKTINLKNIKWNSSRKKNEDWALFFFFYSFGYLSHIITTKIIWYHLCVRKDMTYSLAPNLELQLCEDCHCIIQQ
jgi:hypothetical protein